MTYCPQNKLVPTYLPLKKFSQLVDDNADSLPEAVYAEIESKVDGEINAALQKGGYSLPLATVPPRIERIAAHMITYDLYTRRGMMNNVVEKNYDKAMDPESGLLAQIANGDASLGIEPTPAKKYSGIKGNKAKEGISLSLEHLNPIFPMVGGTGGFEE